MTNEEGKTLFAVALNIRVRTKRGFRWVPHPVEYVHAFDAATARSCIIQSHRQRVDIIAVAPAIGFNVEDNQGKVLSA